MRSIQDLQFPPALSALLLLFPVFPENTIASEEGRNSHSDSTTISLLVCLLLFLLLLLFLAWRRLNHDSQGRYHPRHLVGALVHRWQALRGEVSPEELPQGYQDEREEELEEPEQQQDMEADERVQQEDNQEEQEKEKQEDLNKSIHSESPEEAELQQPSKEDGAKATEGSAEALLSDLHSFSGTATWDDSGEHFHVSTL